MQHVLKGGGSTANQGARIARRQSAPAIQHRDELESEAPSSITQVGGDHTDKNTNGGWKKMKQGLRDMSPARESRPHIKIAEQGNKSMHTRTPSNRLVALTERFNSERKGKQPN